MRRTSRGNGQVEATSEASSRTRRRQAVRARRPLLEALESRTVLSAIPAVSLNLPATSMIGETLQFSVGFDNASPTDPGFGPYVDLFLPTIGVDGAGAAVDDGVTFTSATFLGTPVTATVLTFNGAGQATHPYAKTNTGAAVVVNGTPGNQLVVLQLPFGSFTANQPIANIQVNTSLSNLADLNTPLTISARGGFRYGNDALDNPTVDPSLIGSTVGSTVAPKVIKLITTYIGPEDETATGPNFPRQYRIDADIANGQTLTNVDLTQVLPSNLQFLLVNSTLDHGAAVATTASSTPSTITPGGTLTRRFASVTGTTSTTDASLIFTYYVPLNAAGGAPVINAATGDDVISQSDMCAHGDWTPTDLRDSPVRAVSDDLLVDHVLTDKSIAIQKSVSVVTDTGATGPSPGDRLEYTLTFQISDYFAFQNLNITDLFSDGQRWDATFTPTLSVTEHNATSAGTIAPANFTIAGNFSPDPLPNDGTTTATFRVSNELVTRGLDGKLLGGAVPNLGTGGPPPASSPALFGGTVGTLTFRTIIQESFSDTFPSGDASVDQGDVLANNVSISGDLLSVADAGTPTGFSEADTSATSVQIVTGALTKSIYAINGNTAYSNPATVAAGDTITYRLRYTLPTSDVENMVFRDFLPLPIFLAPEVTNFVDVVSAASPAAGSVKFGPADTFRAYSGVIPTILVSAVSNSLTVNYGSFDSPLNTPTDVDLLFTVTATADPFADGLFLTNQANYTEGSTNGSGNNLDAIVQVRISEPVLNVRKGVVSTNKAGATFSPATAGPVAFNAPGTAGARFAGTIQSTNLASTPIDSNLSGVDANDLVTFALVIENTGSGLYGGFDVSLRDTLPSGFVIPGGGLNLRVVDGTGAVRPFTTLGTGLFDPTGGIRLDDPGATGAIAPSHATNGLNVFVITYDLQLTAAVQASQAINNTVTLFNYASDEAGPDFTATDLTDAATVTVQSMNPVKSIVSTSEAFTGPVSGTERVAIGEIVRYRLVSRLPEGSSTNVRFVDQLPSGLQYLNDGTTTVAFVANGGGITSSTLAGAGLAQSGNASNLGTITPSFLMPGGSILGAPFGNGTDPTFVFGNLVNSDSDVDEEFVVVEFNALVLNSTAGSNDAGDNRNNNFLAQVNGSQSGSTSANAQVVIAEPSITNLTHTVSPGTGDAGDTVAYTLTFSNTSGSNVTTAFDARLLVPLPPQLSLNLGSVNITTAGGVTGASNISAGNTVDFTFASIPAGGSVSITYTATINPGVSPGQAIATPSTLTFTSLPGALGTTVNPTGSATPGATGTDTGERDGSSVAENDYRVTAPATVTIDPIQPIKSIVSTSEAHTGFSGGVEHVAIGEVVRFRFQVRIPEGTGMPAFQLVDLLPNGLTFLDDGTTTVAFVSNGSGVTSSTLSGAGLSQSGNAGNVGSITPSFVLPGSAISGGPFTTGVDPVFSIGDLANADNDGDDEFVVLEFNALVDNSVAGSNDAGDNLVNTYIVRINGSQSGLTSTPATLRVAEPGLTINQLSSEPFADAGDTVSLVIFVDNPLGANATTAFEARILETLPAGLTLVPGTVFVTLSGGASGVTNNTAGNTLDVRIGQIPAGGGVQIAFDAVLATSLLPGQSVNSTAGVTYTSLPGATGTTVNPTGSTTPGATGTNTGERDGSGGQNDYTTVSPVIITIYEHSITGNVYVDADNDGVLDGGETPIQGVSVTLTGTDHLGNPVNLSTTTGVGGNYAFDHLRPGVYAVTETQPGGFLDGKDTVGSPFSGSASSNDIISSVVINPGTPNTTGVGYNFGELRPASVAGSVFEDANNNGAFGGGELGIVGATVTLTGTDDLGNPINLGVTTGIGGAYSFNNLRPGTYTVTETQPSGYLDGIDAAGNTGGTLGNDVVSNFVLVEGNVRTGVTFGELLPASLAGSVYHDANNNGAFDGSELGISGATVTLTGTDDRGNPVNLGTTTSIGGAYSFNNLRPGTYIVTETQPSGFLDGIDAAGTAGGTAGNDIINGVVLVSGTTATSYNFGELLPASLAGSVYHDANNNGAFDGSELGISGATVTLTGTDDRGNPVNLGTTTSIGGAYSFNNLRPGTYIVTETQPSGFLDGIDAAGTAGGTAGNDIINGVVLVSGAAATSYNFGELRPASVSGIVFEDPNNNGVLDGGENGITGATVTLIGTDDRGNPVNLTTTTGIGGVYSFNNLRPGTYSVTETQPFGYLDGIDAAGNTGGTLGNDVVSNFALLEGDARTGVTFGELTPASLAGSVYVDANNNGVLDGGETGIGGASLTLTGTDDLGNPVNLITTTGIGGAYAFNNLRPGTYTVTETQPFGYLDGIDAAGTAGGTAGNDIINGAVLVPGTTAIGYNFGELSPASLSGSVYVDANNNGVFDGGETGITGATVTLTGTDDRGNPVNLGTTTGIGGAYAFNNLRPGTYTVFETQPSGFLDGIDTAGTAGGTAGNDVVNGVVLVSGAAATSYNFGELRPASVSGIVFEDPNNNGVFDGGENGIPGATVTLTGTDDLGNPVNLITTTGIGGVYSFNNLRPGTYTLTETQPSGYLDGIDAAGNTGGTLGNDVVSDFALLEGDARTGVTFGELLPASLAGVVYVDADNNGLINGGEAGISGATVTLTGTDDRGNPVNLTTTTGIGGAYAFNDLRPGTYTVTESQPFGYLDGIDAAGTAGGTAGNDIINGAVLVPGTTATSYNFGELSPASLSGVVYVDADNDGVLDGGETGIIGVDLTLTGTDDRGNPINLTTTTGIGGAYAFNNLRPGTYTVTETQPSGYLDGQDSAGTAGGSVGIDLINGVVLVSGTAATGYNFGELRPTSINGAVFEDANNNGAFDGGEIGITGATVTLAGTDDLGNPVNLTTTTGIGGIYSFSPLRPGTYTVSETQPSGYLDGQDSAGDSGGALGNDLVSNIVLVEGDARTGLDFGELVPASLSGFVYVDANNNGVFDGGETGILGASVTLIGTDDLGNPVNLTTTTGITGGYSFSNLRPGAYDLTESQPSGYLDGLDAAGSSGGTASNDLVTGVTLVPGASATGYDFGELRPASILGRVFDDLNDDGVFDIGEPGILGATVDLTGTDDLGNPVNLTTTTDLNGLYSFGGLRPGIYTVTETQPTGFVDGKDSAGDTGGTLGDDIVSNIVLAEGDARTGPDFGEIAESSIAGFVYNDPNNNGEFDGGETGIVDVVMTLTGTDDRGNPVNLSTMTDAGGAYAFNHLRPGTYTVSESQPAAYLDGLDAAGTAGGTTGNDLVSEIVLSAGTTGADYNFGEIQAASLSGSVYEDANNNGVFDGGETGIAGVMLTLSGTDDRGNPVNLATTTDAGGSYAFNGLRPGVYSVAESQPAGFFDGIDAAGTAGGTAGNDLITGVVLSAEAVAASYDFGELIPASLSGFVYLDQNNDGTKDTGESGILSAILTLTGTDDLGMSVNLTAMTAADGSYTFNNLRPGVYSVSEAQPAGYFDGIDAAGTAGGTAGNDLISGLALVSGAGAIDYNFGELLPASLAGSVYSDTNNNGVRDAGEPGIAGVTVTLGGFDDLGNPVSQPAVTGNDGSYSFTGLRPGNYTLTESHPAAYGDGLDAAGSSGGTAGNDVITAIPIGSGAAATGYTFGERGGVISGSVFVESNPNGIPEPGEPGYAAATVTLLDANGQVIREALTLPDGTYMFTDLPAGQYTIVQQTPDGYNNTNSSTKSASLAPGATLDNQDFGLTSGSLAGSVFEDANGNGIRDAGELGIAGVTITLTGVDSNGLTVHRTVLTGADGSFLFDSMLPGMYNVTESQPSSYLDGHDSAGTSGGFLGDDQFQSIALIPGAHATGYTFGEVLPARIGGSVYLDLNRDRVRQSDEYGIAHVNVTLTGVDDRGQPVSVVSSTNDEGYYQFDGLRPGTYTVTESQPSLFLNGSPNRIPGLVVGSGGASTENHFAELPRKGCKLYQLAHPSNSAGYLQWRRSINPARFDHYHPRVGPMLANGSYKQAALRLPRGPLIHYYVPTLGRSATPA